MQCGCDLVFHEVAGCYDKMTYRKSLEKMNRLTVNVTNRSYSIVIQDCFSSVSKEIQSLWKGEKIVVLTDENVGKIYLHILQQELRKICSLIFTYTLPAGEDSKSIHNVKKIYNFLLQKQFKRRDLLIALGGGVIGDITGFVASTYLRGIPFIQIPTTLLAQIDSSVGGKTAVNYQGYKNMVGSFYHPLLVYINTMVLKTLPEREYTAGLAEAIVHALIADADLLEFIEAKAVNLYTVQQEDLVELIYRNCKIKADIVSQDERDGSVRKILNFGHTVGHAAEGLYGFRYRHGECVSVGIVAAFKLSVYLNLISSDKLTFIRSYLQRIGLPIEFDNLNWKEIVRRIAYDKKYASNEIDYILPIDIGKVTIRRIALDQSIASVFSN